MGSATITGLIIVEANTFGEFSVITDANGRAVTVPEPDALYLFAAGLLALLSWVGRRKGAAPF
jgi:hypothetical protein